MDKKKEMEQKLRELRALRGMGRKSNKDEVLAETLGEKIGQAEGHGEYLARRREQEREAEEGARPASEVVDREKEKLLNTTGLEMASEREKKAKKESRQSFQWDQHNTDSKYKAYKKRIAVLDKSLPLEKDYLRAKETGDADRMDGRIDDLAYGETPEIPEARMKMMLADLEDRKKSNRTKRMRAEYDDEDVAYINADNKQFLRKIERDYGKYTSHIKDALEKGTS